MNKEWFDSFYRFEQQQTARWSYGNFNILGLGLPRRGYMGKKFKDMGQGFSKKLFIIFFVIASILKFNSFENPTERSSRQDSIKTLLH